MMRVPTPFGVDAELISIRQAEDEKMQFEGQEVVDTIVPDHAYLKFYTKRGEWFAAYSPCSEFPIPRDPEEADDIGDLSDGMFAEFFGLKK